jgi:hypothetical protein
VGLGNRADAWSKQGTSRGSLPTDGHARCALCARYRPNRGEGERLTGGRRQQCQAAVLLMSGARRAAGEGERSGALIGRIDLLAGVDGGEAAPCAGRAWAGPGRKKVGRDQINSRISDLFKSVLNKFKLI